MNIYDFTVKDCEGNDISMEKYRGKTLLIVNTAPGCFFANQYKALEKIYEEMKERDFEIVDFPCNQFLEQASGSSQEIACLCQARYGITFDQYAKLEVNGEGAHPLFKYLQENATFCGFGANLDSFRARMGYSQLKRQRHKEGISGEKNEIRWNFTKFLVNKDGEVVARFEPAEPVEVVRNEINRLLNGEDLSERRRFKRKEKDAKSYYSKKLFRQRLAFTILFFWIAYFVNFAFDLIILQHNGVEVFSDKIVENFERFDLGYSSSYSLEEELRDITHPEELDEHGLIFKDRRLVTNQFLLPVPGAFLLSLAFFGFSIRNSGKVNKLCTALEQASDGNLNYRLKVNEKDLYERPYRDFNIMCRELKDTMGNLQDAVLEANKANEAKSSFLSNMSHEIRTPLNSVLGMDEMILRESSEPEIIEYALNIKNSGRTLLSLINDILDFSKIEANKLEIIPIEYELSSIINDLINMVRPKAEAKGLDLQVSVDTQMPHLLYGDEIRIKQVCLNIVNNAIKYTAEGFVKIRFESAQVDGNNAIRFICTDSGQGIKPEDLSKLSQPFVRINEKQNRTIEGTGLGMSITKNLLALMDSKLEVESEYQKGSTFSFTLKQETTSLEPIGDFEEKYKQMQENRDVYTEAFHASNAKILIVDDVEMNLIVAKNFLKRTLINVVTATSGRGALEKTNQEQYDLILIDHMMPDMDGIETLHNIRTNEGPNRNTPVIVLTANAVSGAREKYLSEGFDDYLTKPIDGERLEKTIRMYLDASLIEKVNADTLEAEDKEQENLILIKIGDIENISIEEGVKNCGDEANYISIVENFGQTAENRISLIDEYWKNTDIKNYTIQVHALKSSARLVGQMELSEMAKRLEQAGNEEDVSLIQSQTTKLLDEYRKLADDINSVFETQADKETIDPDMLKDGITTIYEALSVFDIDMADDVIKALDEYKMPGSFEAVFSEIKMLMSSVDRDGVMKLIDDNGDAWR